MVKPSRNKNKKQKRTEYSDAFKEQAVRLWGTGDYESISALAKHLKMGRKPLSNWIKAATEGKKSKGVAILSKLETNKIERFIEETIITAQDTLRQLEPKDRANYSMQLLDRLTELRKNIIILPGDWDTGTGMISDEDAMTIISMIPEEGRGAFIKALKDAKDVVKK